MRILRHIYPLLLGTWLGAILFFGGVVAPALFRVVPDQAGAVVRTLIPRLDAYAMVVALALVGLSLVGEGRPDRRGVIRLILLAGIFTLAAVSFFGVTPAMESLRESAGGSVTALAKDDPVRQRFGMLHGVSTLLMLGELLLGLAAFALPLRTAGEPGTSAAKT